MKPRSAVHHFVAPESIYTERYCQELLDHWSPAES